MQHDAWLSPITILVSKLHLLARAQSLTRGSLDIDVSRISVCTLYGLPSLAFLSLSLSTSLSSIPHLVVDIMTFLALFSCPFDPLERFFL